MAEMKTGYKQTDIGVIPEDWDEALIGDLFDFKNGLNKAKEFFGYGTPIVNYMDVFNFSGLRINNVQGKVDVTFQEKQNFSVKKGDVFFTRTSETVEDIGVASVMLDDCNETVFSGFVLRGRPKTKLIEEDYCKYCFSSDEVRKQITSKSTYTTRALTNGRLLSSVILPLPKSEEQKQIAAALSDVDGLIESLSQLIAKKRDMKTAAMQQLLTGKKRLPGFDGEWAEKRIDEFGFFKSGNGFPTKYQGHQQGDYPFFKVSDMNNFGNATHMTVSNNYISHEIAKTLSVNIIPEKSIIFAKIGAAIFLERKKITVQQSCIDNNMMAFIPDHHISDYTFFHYLFLHLTFGRLVAATALPSLSPKDIGGLALYIPKKNEQTAIAAILSDMDTEISALEQRLGKARSLKTGMMQELLTGRTRLIKTNKKQEAA